jgi:hypothetical protein
MPKARKKHMCTLCHESILKGENYIYNKITIWDHSENDTFGTYKAHNKCDDLWINGIGKDMDWMFPTDKYEWNEELNHE